MNKLKKGDRIDWRGRKGTLLTDAVFRTGQGGYGARWGLHFADISWDDGTVKKDFMVSRTDLTVIRNL